MSVYGSRLHPSPYAVANPSRLRFQLDFSEADGETQANPLNPSSPPPSPRKELSVAELIKKVKASAAKKMQSKTTLSNKKQCRRPITDVKLAKAMLALRILMRRSLRPVPVTKSQQKKPVERMYQVPLWDAVGALAEFEAWKLAVSAGAPHRVLSPVNVSRLLQIGWITRFEAHQCGGLDLLEFRKQCLIKALIKARCYDGKHPLVITDDFLGLTDRPLYVGGGSSVIRWEDGEAPWMLAWTGSSDLQPPMKTLVHTFNSRNIPGATSKSSATYEMDMACYTTLAKHRPLTR